MGCYTCNNNLSMVNSATLHGYIVAKDTQTDSQFQKLTLAVKRKSGAIDQIPIVAPCWLTDSLADMREVSVSGEWRSRNHIGSGNTRMQYFVFARSITDDESEDYNVVELTGYVCRKPIYRETLTRKGICELLIAVNRPNGRSDYLPGIAWNQTARRAYNLNVGDKIKLSGRIQSREYLKVIGGIEEVRTAYEVSAQSIAKVE